MQIPLPDILTNSTASTALLNDEPAFWVRRLRVLRSLTPGDEHVLRDIVLRRGLNIVWAPPDEPSADGDLSSSGVFGHTAGKTTFCRLLRFALGEGTFATETTRRRIRARLPSGWLVAEVVVAARLWLIARPFGIGAHPFCIEDADVDGLFSKERFSYQLFIDALQSATVATLPVRRYPADDEPVMWDNLLPWLTRDQECRFSEFVEWRHNSSDSDSPSLSADERQLLVRSVLGLITAEESAEQQRNARLVAERKRASMQQPLLAHQADVDHGRLEQMFGHSFPRLDTGFFGGRARDDLEHRSRVLNEKRSELFALDIRAERRKRLEEAVSHEAEMKQTLKDAEGRIELTRGAIDQLSGKLDVQKRRELLSALPPGWNFCNVPMPIARERGCPIATFRPIELDAKRSERSSAEEIEQQRELLRFLKSEVRKLQQQVATASSSTAAARDEYLRAATAFEQQHGQLMEEQFRLAEAERLIEHAERAWSRSQELAESIGRLDEDIDSSYERQDIIRRQSRESLGRFSETFDDVVRACLGNEVRGRVESSGRSLKLVVEHDGERESAAVETVKLLAFDLAALTYNMRGGGFFPRFLVHDGPREADMAAPIYARLFWYVESLERRFTAEPGFQYIVTTTSRPPEALLSEPWLRLQLAGVPQESRLLKMNL